MDFDNPKVYGDTFISDGLVYVNNIVYCADDGVDHGDCSYLSKGADGIGADDSVGVDIGDCSNLSEGGDGVE